MPVVPLCLVDAASFGDTITVVEEYDSTTQDALTTQTLAGTATFTYTRLTVASLVKFPKAPLSLEAFGQLSVPSKSFVAVQGATGKMPGWLLVCGGQPTQVNAFTNTVTQNDGGGTPVVYHLNAYCNLAAVCVPAAPGRFVKAGSSGLLSIVGTTQTSDLLAPLDGIVAEGANNPPPAMGVAYTVTTLVAGAAATSTRAAVLPVFRVTLPSDAAFVSYFTILVNGIESRVGDPDGTDGVYIADCGFPFGAGDVYSRSPWVFDVQMPNYSDTLAVGTISYYRAKQNVSLVRAAGTTMAIADPFNLKGQTFSSPADASGFSVRVSF